MAKYKRGQSFYNTLTEANCYLYRIKSETVFLVSDDPSFGIDAKYYDADVCDLSPLYKPRTPVKQQSEKKKQSDKIYSTLRAVFLQNKPVCEAKVSVCTTKATEVHHKAGRGENTLNIKTWLAVCSSCHKWIELHPIRAKELGLSENRL